MRRKQNIKAGKQRTNVKQKQRLHQYLVEVELQILNDKKQVTTMRNLFYSQPV